MSNVLKVVIFSWGAGNQQYGLGQDAKIMEQVLKEMVATGKTRVSIAHADPYSYAGKGALPEPVDVHIYLEVPCRVAWNWAKVNVVIPNAEWWYLDAWKWVLKEPSAIFWYRSSHCQRLFEKAGVERSRGYRIGWRCPVNLAKSDAVKLNQALFIVGGSKHKMAAAGAVVRAWKSDWPKLIVLGAEAAPEDCPEWVEWRNEYVSAEEKQRLQAESRIHVVASQAEGFGYTMAEALNNNALVLRTDLPVYEEMWGAILGSMGCIKTSGVVDVSGATMLDPPRSFDETAVEEAVLSLIDNQRKISWASATSRATKDFRDALTIAWKGVEGRVKKAPKLWVPPVVPVADELPVLGVVTLTHNRPEWFSHAVRNIETSEYPRSKMIWVVVDDSDGDGRVDAQIERAKEGLPDLQIQYMSLPKKTAIGEKRNRGCVAAAVVRPDVAVFAFMDDDDHYPKASLTVRASWLMASGKDLVYCSTLPMYDIRRYISAVNVPPLNISPAERVSEATLCFKRLFWEESRFPKDVSVAEGEGFIKGREERTVEIPPEGVIVSFLHGKNFTSRRVPDQKEPNGCHFGFSNEYFTMISKLSAFGARDV